MATNAEILEAFSVLGINLGPLSTKGAQSNAFKTRVLSSIPGGLAEAQKKWEAALKLASFKPPAGADTRAAINSYLDVLQQAGVIDNRKRQEILGVKDVGPGVQRSAGRDPAAITEALGNTLGWNHPAVQMGVRRAGVPVTPRLQQFLDSASQYGQPFNPSQHMYGDTAQPAGAAPAQPAIPMGRTPNGEATKNLQMLLNARGANLPVDGKYGPATAAAQQKYGTGSVTTTTPKAPGAPSGQTLGGALGGGGGGGGGGGAGGGGAPAPAPYVPPLRAGASDAEVESHIRRNMGFAAWALDVPEIRGVLVDFTRRMQGEDFTDEQLEQSLMGTQWWKEKSATQRTRIEERHRDPGTYLEGVNLEMDKLRENSLKYGLNLSDTRLREMAEQSYKLGWSDTERNGALSAEFDYNPDTGEDSGAQIVTDLKGRAKQYLMPLSEATIDKWGQDIIAGKATFETFDQYAAGIAKTLFPVFAKQIEAGQTPGDLIEPFKLQASKYLEIDPESIDFTDPKWMRTLEANNPDGSRSLRGMADFADLIRTDSQYGWDKTRNAREHAAQLAADLGKQFGAV